MRYKAATPDNYKKFGKIVKSPSEEPTALTKEFKFWSDITNYNISGETEIGICTVFRHTNNEITLLERHLRTPEILIPIDTPLILPVLVEGEPEDKTEAFWVEPGEAIVINSAVWHGACLPVGKEISSYFVFFRKGTPFEDVEKKEIYPIIVDM